MLKDSLVGFADDFAVAGGAAFFMAGAGDCAGADFGAVCASAADGIDTNAANEKQIAEMMK